MSTAHGFGNVQAQIARKSGVSMKRAGAMLAATTRRAGPAARKRNPRLNRVKGYRRGGMVKGYKRGGSVREKPYGTKMCRRDGMTVETPNGD
jgi:hypothetical protein